MHVSLFLTSRPPPPGPTQAVLEQGLGWLRAELGESASPERVAALRYELGRLEQTAGHDSVAVRDLLAAVNTVASFREPLECLIALIERHRSFKNLPMLLDHLCRIADTPDEVARARLARAWQLLRHQDDPVAALHEIEAVLSAAPSDAPAWLSLEILGWRLQRPELIERALLGRAAAAPSGYKGLLLLDLAELHAERGEAAQAKALLDRSLSESGELSWQALTRLHALGQKQAESGWILQALEGQARLLLDPNAPVGLPRHVREPAHATELLLRLARFELALGKPDAALASLTRGLELTPDSTVLLHAALATALATEKYDAAESWAARELAHGSEGSDAAALWLEIAHARLGRGLVAAAGSALESALAQDRDCWVAQALELDVLCKLGAESVLGQVFERIATEVHAPHAKLRYWLLAAERWARGARNPVAAAVALARAQAVGAPRALVLRIARVLAHTVNDAPWYESATRELLTTELSQTERAGLTLELLRSAVQRRDTLEIARQRDGLAALPEHAFLSWLVSAYVEGAEHATESRSAALLALAEREEDKARSVALKWAAALGLLRAGSELDARSLLQSLYDQYPEDPVIAGTLSGHLLSQPDSESVLSVLRRSALKLNDGALGASLFIEAGLRSFHAGDRLRAIQDFEAAQRRDGGAASTLEAWARRASRRTDAVSDWTTGNEEEQLLLALRRISVPSTSASLHSSLLERALSAQSSTASAGLVGAAGLGLMLWGSGLNGRLDTGSLGRFAAENLDCQELARASSYLHALERGEEASSLEVKARAWSEINPALVPALEWFGAALRSANTEQECLARERIAELLSPEPRALVLAGAALVRQLARGELPALVDGASIEVQLVNLELAPPGCDPRRRIAALAGAPDALGEEEAPLASLITGYNQLALGERSSAAACFLRYTSAFPDDPMGWEGLLTTASDAEDPVLLAEATAALGNTTTDPSYGAQLFERAADILFDTLDDAVAGEAALVRAVELDVSRRSSFDRLFAIVHARGELEPLLELCARRLAVSQDPEERARLFWERARALRQLGDTAAATEALKNVTVIRPDHAGALALLGEIYVTSQRYAEAAEKLARLAALPGAPLAERLTSGIAAVDLFENKLDATERALAVLLELQRAALGTLAVRERLARAAAKAGAWDEAAVALEQLMFERETADERSEAARLALAIHRDRRAKPEMAGRAAEVLLALCPGDAEALELVLAGNFDAELTSRLLAQGRLGLLLELEVGPLDTERIALLARLAQRTHDRGLLQVSLGALVALGQASGEELAELDALDPLLRHTPEVAIEPELLERLQDREDAGPIAELLRGLGPHLGRALGPSPAVFNATKKNRVPPGSGLPLRDEIAAWAGAFQLGDFELHLSDTTPGRIRALPGEPPTLIVGAGVEAPLLPPQRLELVRELYALKRGLSFVAQYDPSDVAALIVALYDLGGVSLSAPHYARRDDFKRQLGRALSRGERKALVALATRAVVSHADILRWIDGCIGSLDRMAALAVGDPSWLIAQIENQRRGETGSPSSWSPRAVRLLAFALSASFVELRDKLGMSRR